jgi:hypothetical protein
MVPVCHFVILGHIIATDVNYVTASPWLCAMAIPEFFVQSWRAYRAPFTIAWFSRNLTGVSVI